MPVDVRRFAGTTKSISVADAAAIFKVVAFHETVSGGPEHGADDAPASELPKIRSVVAALSTETTSGRICEMDGGTGDGLAGGIKIPKAEGPLASGIIDCTALFAVAMTKIAFAVTT